MQNGELISAVRGTVKSLFKRNAGTNSHGDWSMQNMEIADGGAVMKVVIKDRPALPQTLKGQVLLIQCNVGDNGMTGVKANDNEYPKNSGKITREIYVTPSAHLLLPNGELTEGCTSAPLTDAAPAMPAPAAPAPTHQSAPAPQQSAARPQNGQGDEAMKALRTFLARRGNGWALCRMVAMRKAEQIKELTGTQLPEDALQAATASLYISADRAGLLDAIPSYELGLIVNKKPAGIGEVGNEG
jgi:hypothetical protein